MAVHRGGYAPPQIILTAAIHARECYTSLVVLEQIRRFSAVGGGAYFVPLVNPDGAVFFESGETGGFPVLEANRHRQREWKANAEGVDLNCNFDAHWGRGRSNKLSPGASDYIGAYPFCATESAALATFTQAVGADATVSYHCMGGELYWEFFQSGEARLRDMKLASAIARKIRVKRVDGHLFSAGGYKDWCISELKIPAFTVELISSGTHPFAPSDFADDIDRNADLPEFVLGLLGDINGKT